MNKILGFFTLVSASITIYSFIANWQIVDGNFQYIFLALTSFLLGVMLFYKEKDIYDYAAKYYILSIYVFIAYIIIPLVIYYLSYLIFKSQLSGVNLNEEGINMTDTNVALFVIFGLSVVILMYILLYQIFVSIDMQMKIYYNSKIDHQNRVKGLNLPLLIIGEDDNAEQQDGSV